MKELSKIKKKIQAISGDYPQKKEKLLSERETAMRDIREAKASIEDAETMEEYDKAVESLSRAELSLSFINKGLDKIESSPRMSEREYTSAVSTCKAVMDDATKEYRSKTEYYMAQMKALKDKYLETVNEVNETLIALDEASNVLQSRYPYKIHSYEGLEDRVVPDKDAWREYAVRYTPLQVHAMATGCTEEERGECGWKTHDSVLVNAWTSLDKAYPRQIY